MAQALQFGGVSPTHYSLHFRVHTRISATLLVAIMVAAVIWTQPLDARPKLEISAVTPLVTRGMQEKEKENDPPRFLLPFALPFYFFP